LYREERKPADLENADANIPVRSSEAVVRGTLNWILFGTEFGVKINGLSPNSKLKSAYYKLYHQMKQGRATAETNKRSHDEMEKEIEDDDTLACDAKKENVHASPFEQGRVA
jgi:hypothetical protein